MPRHPSRQLPPTEAPLRGGRPPAPRSRLASVGLVLVGAAWVVLVCGGVFVPVGAVDRAVLDATGRR